MRFRIVWLTLGGAGDWCACVRDPTPAVDGIQVSDRFAPRFRSEATTSGSTGVAPKPASAVRGPVLGSDAMVDKATLRPKADVQILERARVYALTDEPHEVGQ